MGRDRAIGAFPVGPRRGTARSSNTSFTAAEAPESSDRRELIDAELRRAGLDSGLQNYVMAGLEQVLQTPLGGLWVRCRWISWGRISVCLN